MSKVLVTGANGFLGSWVTRHLVQQGHEVTALVRKTSDLSELQGVDCQFSYGDITDSVSLEQAAKGKEYVFHLAGLIAYKASERNKMELINVQGTKNVIDACRTQQVQRMVYLSSVVAIGAGFTKQQILNESSAYNVGHLNLGYFETKHQAEELVHEATQLGLIDSVILNPSTIYGAGDAKKGSRKTQVKVAQGKFPFFTSGGVNVVAVEDVVGGIISAWKRGRSGERYILSGENLLIKDLFRLIAQAAGRSAPKYPLPDFLLHGLGAIGDQMDKLGFKGTLSKENAWTATLYHWFDSSKAQKELDFKPQAAEVAIQNSVNWMKETGRIS
ncbi:MAG: NAD-dependent epimerase/dehydratase family protein [Pseudobdellovibrionaceae bacterium]|jgi:dihydroflavonol-4-reductase